MTGSRPNPPPASPAPAFRRRRAVKPLMPWGLISSLLILYILIGLMLSVSSPPYWVWIPAILGSGLLAAGLTQPLIGHQKPAQAGLMAYSGGLLLVVPLAVAANYVGGDQSFDNIRFAIALVSLAVLTLLAVLLTAAAAIVTARTGTQLMRTANYQRSLSVLLITCFSGILLGGLAGFLTLTLTAGN